MDFDKDCGVGMDPFAQVLVGKPYIFLRFRRVLSFPVEKRLRSKLPGAEQDETGMYCLPATDNNLDEATKFCFLEFGIDRFTVIYGDFVIT